LERSLPSEYLAFIELFNQGKFFQAHEVLEHLWRREHGGDRDFYQGLIQIAAVFVHVQKQTPDGAQKMFSSASAYLKKYLPVYKRLNVGELLSETSKSLLAKSGSPQLYLEEE